MKEGKQGASESETGANLCWSSLLNPPPHEATGWSGPLFFSFPASFPTLDISLQHYKHNSCMTSLVTLQHTFQTEGFSHIIVTGWLLWSTVKQISLGAYGWTSLNRSKINPKQNNAVHFFSACKCFQTITLTSWQPGNHPASSLTDARTHPPPSSPYLSHPRSRMVFK